MNGKSWWASKMNWFGVLTSVSGSVELVAHYIEKGNVSVSGVLLLIVGIVNIVLRTFFTDKPIA